MTPLALAGLGAPELLIILAVVLLLFGGSRIAGLGKSSGRALREFKEETRKLGQDGREDRGAATQPAESTGIAGSAGPAPVADEPARNDPVTRHDA